MEGDLASFVKVTAIVTASMAYAHYASASTRPGLPRLISLLPIIILFPILPFFFSSLQLRTISSFLLCWLSLSKLLLLSFGSSLGPLSPSLPLFPFIAIASLPVKTQPANSNPNTCSSANHHTHLLVVNIIPFFIRAILLILVFYLYKYKAQINPYALLSIYCLHIYLALEVVLGSAAFLTRALLGLELEPQFDAPFRSRSLQEFWGRRWNLMVTGILRPTVYRPIRSRFGTAAGVMAAFLVSGIMHEIMFCYLTLEGPTGEVTLFFLVHGVCTVAEVKVKKAGWHGPRPVVGTVVTLGFVGATAFWLFIPPMLRGGVDEKGLEECLGMLRLMEEGGAAALRWFTA